MTLDDYSSHIPDLTTVTSPPVALNYLPILTSIVSTLSNFTVVYSRSDHKMEFDPKTRAFLSL